MGVGAAVAAAGAASAIGGVVTGLNASDAAKSAGQLQSDAANRAVDAQLAMYNQTRGDLAPYRALGENALLPFTQLTGTNEGGNPLTAPLTAPFRPTLDQLQGTPGYQFSLDQGLKATQNAFTAQGLGRSGGALAGAANYAEGLAGTTFQDQFKNYLAQNQQIYNMLAGPVTTGAGAAGLTGQLGMQATTTANNFLTGGAAAQGAGLVGGANALATGANNATNALLTAGLGYGIFGKRAAA
jgi:hypothetical protein